MKIIKRKHFYFAERHSTRCCDDNGRLLSNNNPHCFSIIIPEDDPVFSKYNRMCMNFVRSTTDIDSGCNPGTQPAEQVRDQRFIFFS